MTELNNNINCLFSRLKKEFWSAEFIRFIMIGIITVGLNFGLRFIFRLVFSFNTSVMLSTIFATSINFILNRIYTFNIKNRKYRKQIVRFIVASVVGMILLTILSNVFLAALKISTGSVLTEGKMEAIAHLCAIGICSTIYGYLATKYYVYRTK
jgi:putative flippase GtrA